jgi:hypothetical protein
MIRLLPPAQTRYSLTPRRRFHGAYSGSVKGSSGAQHYKQLLIADVHVDGAIHPTSAYAETCIHPLGRPHGHGSFAFAMSKESHFVFYGKRS